MQSGSMAESESEPNAASATSATRDDDSGLHDIRSLAQSAKMRAAKRGSTSPPVRDDDIATSGAWKAVALPEPAKMISLPAVEDLPPAREVVAKAKAASAPAPQRQTARTPKGLYAGIGLALAAAAGVTIYLTTQRKAEPPVVADRERPTPPPQVAIATTSAGVVPGAATTPVAPADEGIAAPAADTKVAVPEPEKPTVHGKSPAKAAKKADPAKADAVAPPAPDKDKKPDKKSDKKPDEDPSFDALLKEAGVDQNKKVDRPKLDKKELSGDDFKRGIGAVAKKAQACYKGTQGTVGVKLTIAPSGAVTKVAAMGAFAGTPEGDCVQKAVQGATFPAWDGGPQSFTYSYLLSE